jgi:hypothetical protein
MATDGYRRRGVGGAGVPGCAGLGAPSQVGGTVFRCENRLSVCFLSDPSKKYAETGILHRKGPEMPASEGRQRCPPR